ncbi:hypothetical protein H0H93_014328 [Arthromyces matolae]|nr:hypothetical protein H0H93_014328 [Arthromyces matolae]
MPTPDLPTELWFIILSLLPWSYRRKVIGVSRHLFEIAMDSLYNEFRFVADDKQMVRALKQLKHPSICLRVRHIYIRPDFLPGVDTTQAMTHKRTILSFPTRLFKRRSDSTSDLKRAQEVIQLANDNLHKCTQAIALTIVLHDLDISPVPSFTKFFQSLLSIHGSRLRDLVVDVTLEKWLMILNPSVFQHLSNLTSLTIKLSGSRFTEPSGGIVKESVVASIASLSQTLESLIISTPTLIVLNPLFDGVARLPALRKFILSINIPFVMEYRVQIRPTSSLPAFIKRHQATLQHLAIRVHHCQTFLLPYELWLLNDGLDLSKIEQLELGVFSSPSLRLGNTSWSQAMASLPALPLLRSLIIHDKVLSFSEIEDLCNILSASKAMATLRHLELKIRQISPKVVDFFAQRLSLIEEFELAFEGLHLSVSSAIFKL